MNLYEITLAYEEVFRELTDLDDLPDGCLEDTLSSFTPQINELAVNLAAFIKNMEAEAEAIDNARRNMDNRSERLKNKSKKLKMFLLNSLDRCKIKKINHAYFDISTRDNAPSVLIEDEKLLPSAYWVEYLVVKKPDKNAIKKDIASGIDVPGAKLIINRSLLIK